LSFIHSIAAGQAQPNLKNRPKVLSAKTACLLNGFPEGGIQQQEEQTQLASAGLDSHRGLEGQDTPSKKETNG